MSLTAQVRDHERRARELYEISKTLRQPNFSLAEVLRHILDAAVRLSHARYGALGVFDQSGQRLVDFLTVGVDDATRAAIGQLPSGRGLLGTLDWGDDVIRLQDLTKHPTFTGFPPHHPPMRSFLGVSIRADGRLFGRIYLTDKKGPKREFSKPDEQILAALSVHAGLAIEDRLYVEQIKTTEALYWSTMASLPVSVVRLDQHGVIRLANPRFYELVQRNEADVVGRSIASVLPIDGQGDIDELLRIAQTQGKLAMRDVEGVSPAGERRVLRVYIAGMNAAVAAAAAAADLVLIIEDVTERKQMEDSLRQRTEQLNAINDSLMRLVQSDNWREAAKSLLRVALKETESEYGFIGVVVEGPMLRILAHAGVVWDQVENREFYEQALRTYQEQGYLEFTNFNNLFGRTITSKQVVIANDPPTDPRAGGLPSGHPSLRQFLGVPILREAEAIGMIGLANCPGGYTGLELGQVEILTEAALVLFDRYRRHLHERQLEQQLHQTEKMAALGTLIAGVSHEINNPLFALAGYVELAQENVRRGDHTTLVEDLAQINEITERITGIVARFLDVARPAKKHREPCSVNELLEQALQLAANDLFVHNIALRKDFTPNLPLIVAHPEELLQVFLNLFTNARQAMVAAHGKGTLAVTTRLSPRSIGEQVEIRVADDGVGIAREHLARLFEPFFTTKPVGEGTGLGLSLCHRIVSDLGGSIVCHSEKGRGATFLITLPVADKGASEGEGERDGE